MAIFKTTLSNRRLLTPQFRSYDNLKNEWKPFVMYFHEKNYKSPHVSTDEFGFRLTEINGKKYSISSCVENFCEVSIIVGGSTVFGVGSTSDKNTIPSIMSESTNDPHLNFGGRAYGCNQELILFMQFAHKFKKIKEVVIFSGLNELYLSRPILGGDIFGNFFFGNIYKSGMNAKNLSLKRKIYNQIFKKNIPESSSNYFDVEFTLNQMNKTLFIWKKLAESYKFNLKFVLQPTPEWSQKTLTKEESVLFAELDKFDNHRLISKLNSSLYNLYSDGLEKLCTDHNIGYHDSNKTLRTYPEYSNWIYVDRAHMTDLGNTLISKFLLSLKE